MFNKAEINSLKILPAEEEPCIKVIGVGHQGCQAIERMTSSQWYRVEFAQIWKDFTNPEKIQDSYQRLKCRLLPLGDIGSIEKFLENGDMAIVVGSIEAMDIKTAKAIAKEIRKKNMMTLGILMPTAYKPILNNILKIETLSKTLNASLIFPCLKQEIKTGGQSNNKFLESAIKAVHYVIKGITDIAIGMPGLIILDINDLRAIWRSNVIVYMGMGIAKGVGRAIKASKEAVYSLSRSGITLHESKNILMLVRGGADLSLHEINKALLFIEDKAHKEANRNIEFGSVADVNLKDKLHLMLFVDTIKMKEI